jgi:hypothetical protein
MLLPSIILPLLCSQTAFPLLLHHLNIPTTIPFTHPPATQLHPSLPCSHFPHFRFFGIIMAVPLLPQPLYIMFHGFNMPKTFCMTHHMSLIPPTPSTSIFALLCTIIAVILLPATIHTFAHHIILFSHAPHSLYEPSHPLPPPHFRFFSHLWMLFYIHSHYIPCIYV